MEDVSITSNMIHNRKFDIFLNLSKLSNEISLLGNPSHFSFNNNGEIRDVFVHQ